MSGMASCGEFVLVSGVLSTLRTRVRPPSPAALGHFRLHSLSIPMSYEDQGEAPTKSSWIRAASLEITPELSVTMPSSRL